MRAPTSADCLGRRTCLEYEGNADGARVAIRAESLWIKGPAEVRQNEKRAHLTLEGAEDERSESSALAVASVTRCSFSASAAVAADV